MNARTLLLALAATGLSFPVLAADGAARPSPAPTAAPAPAALSDAQKNEVLGLFGAAITERPDIVVDAIVRDRQNLARQRQGQAELAYAMLLTEASLPDARVLLGKPTAKRTVVLFETPECAPCALVFGALKNNIGDAAKVLVRTLPVASKRTGDVVPRALYAADLQGKWLEFREAVRDAHDLTEADVAGIAGKLGLDTARFNADMVGPGAILTVQRTAVASSMLGLANAPVVLLDGHLYRPSSAAEVVGLLEAPPPEQQAPAR